MTLMFYGVDGTGPWNDQEYRQIFQNSHVNKLSREFCTIYNRYVRGPSLDGLTNLGKGKEARKQIKAWLYDIRSKGGVQPFICLAGYSRGGAAVIVACNQLKEHEIRVDCLLLFDAVDLSSAVNVWEVPSNVDVVAHARRHGSAGSRSYFLPCGTSKALDYDTSRVQDYWEKKVFETLGTHGAMGGVPHTPEMEKILIEKGGLRSEVASHTAQSTAAAVAVVKPAYESRKPEGTETVTEDFLGFDDSTNVTYDQDKAASEEVGQWMRERLNFAKALYFKRIGKDPHQAYGPMAY